MTTANNGAKIIIRKGSEIMDLISRNFYLDDIFNDFISPKKESKMKCDIYEKDGDYHIEVDIPGFNKDDINIETKNGYIIISAEKKEEINDEEKNYNRRERRYGKYERSFYIVDTMISIHQLTNDHFKPIFSRHKNVLVCIFSDGSAQRLTDVSKSTADGNNVWRHHAHGVGHRNSERMSHPVKLFKREFIFLGGGDA